MLRLVARRAVAGRGGSSLGGRVGFASSAAGRTGRLEGKVALITGGASGLGKATAHEFIREGATVVLADIDSDHGLKAAQELGQQAQFIRCDVTVEQQLSEAVDFVVSTHDRLDVMHNSAGIVGALMPPDIASLDLADFDRVMAVNVRGTLTGIKHAARVMGPRGSGSILCTASMSGILGGLGMLPYSISKHTILGIVRTAASELCRCGVRVNCISPFAVPTPLVIEQFAQMYRGATSEQITKIINSLGELKGGKCEAIDVAKAAVYLASDEAKYVSGHNLVVDGAFTCYKHLNMPVPGSDGL